MDDKFKFITSWDDGGMLDLSLAEILKKYEIPAIFYIPTNCEIKKSDIFNLNLAGFEIGGHTVSHPQDMKTLEPARQYAEIKENKEWLEDIIDEKIISFCYPKGRYNEGTIEQVKKAGFLEARTTLVGNYHEPDDPYRIAPTVHVYPDRKEYAGAGFLNYAKNAFIQAQRKGNYYHIWGHSWEIQKFGLWVELQELFKFIKNEI